MSELEEEIDWGALARSSLIQYAIAQKDNYKPQKYHKLIGKYLDKVEKGEIKRLMVFAPPQHGKSELVTQLFPGYFLGKHPDQSLIVGGYAQEKADDFGRATKGYMATDNYQAIFPDVKISTSSDAIHRFATTVGGQYFTCGIGGPVTGRGSNGLILDDPYKNREEADSESRNQLVINWYKSTFRTRLRGDGFIILVQTRWNKRDLAQWLLDNEGENEKYKWTVINLLAVIEDEADAEADPLHRKIGETLWPEVFPPDVMEQIKKDIGTRDWNALYEQRPSDAKGEIYQRDWFRFWCNIGCKSDHQHNPIPDKFDRIVQVWDCSFKKTKTSDYVVGLAGGVKGANVYILDRSKKRNDLPGTIKQIREFSARHPNIMWKGVEDKANGPGVISTLQTEIPGLVPMSAIDGKPGRWHATAPAVESGNVFLPYGAAWTDDFIEVCASTPNGKYDDDADALAYLILKLVGKRLTGMLEWMKEQVENLTARSA